MVLGSDKRDAYVVTLGILANLSASRDNHKLLASDPPGVLGSLVNMIDLYSYDNSDARKAMFRLIIIIMKNISYDKSCQALLCSPNLKFLEIIVGKFQHINDNENQLKLLTVLHNLSLHEENELRMCSSSVGMVELLIQIAKVDRSELRVKALGIVWNLATNDRNKERLSSLELGLLELLVATIREGEVESQKKALGILRILSSDTNCKLRMSLDSLGLIDLLLGLCKLETDCDVMEMALGLMRNLSALYNNKLRMGAESLGLIESLISLIRENRYPLCHSIIVNILFNLSLHYEIKSRMKSWAITEHIVDVCINSTSSEVKMKSLSLLWNLSSSKSTNILSDPDQFLESSSRRSPSGNAAISHFTITYFHGIAFMEQNDTITTITTITIITIIITITKPI
jgi:hypothetical protein